MICWSKWFYFVCYWMLAGITSTVSPWALLPICLVAFSLGTAWSRDTEHGIEEHLYGVLHVDALGESLPLGLAAGCCVPLRSWKCLLKTRGLEGSSLLDGTHGRWEAGNWTQQSFLSPYIKGCLITTHLTFCIHSLFWNIACFSFKANWEESE